MRKNGRICWALALLSLLTWESLAEEPITSEGLMLIAKQSVIANDMLFIAKTIFENAMFATFLDIKEEEGQGMFKRGMYMTDILVTNVEYHPEILANKLQFDPKLQRFFFETKEPLVRYTFSFNWNAKALGAHLAYGTGTATVTTNSVVYDYGLLPKAFGGLKVAGFVNVTSLTGTNALTPNLKEWVQAKMEKVNYPVLLGGIQYNVHFIVDYMLKSYLNVDRPITDTDVLTYRSKSINVTVANNLIMYAFSTELLVNGVPVAKVSEASAAEAFDPKHDLGVYLSPQLVPIVMQIYAGFKHFDGVFDMRRLGLTGTVQDFFNVLPELQSTYQGSEPVTMACEYVSSKGIQQYPERWLRFPLECRFFLRETRDVILLALGELKMKYAAEISTDVNRLYVARVSQSSAINWQGMPQSPDLTIFLIRVMKAFAQAKFEAAPLCFPKLRYEPLRNYANFEAAIVHDTYVSFYDDAPF